MGRYEPGGFSTPPGPPPGKQPLEPGGFPTPLLRAARSAGALVPVPVGVAAVVGPFFLGTWAGLLAFPIAYSFFYIVSNPALRLLGVFRYHSPLLKVSLRSRRYYEVHSGTLLDYVLLFRWKDRGGRATRQILGLFLEGFLDIANAVERGEIARDTHIVGTSYFFSEKSAERLGFRLESAGLRLRLVLFVSYAELALLHSFARGRLSFPNVLNVRTAVVRGDELLARRDEMRRILTRLREIEGGPEGQAQAA